MSIQSDQSQWKAKHPGVPKEWKQVGTGGNAIVWSDGTRAIKRLRPNTGQEAKARFEREARILLSLQDSPELRIVRLYDVREREGQAEMIMDLMDGNLDAVIDRFAGAPRKAASVLVPIAETLLALVQRGNRIHHRDIKPSNLLFRGNEDNLFLADFGCAYLAEDERLTPSARAMGAWAYRPPEYSVGRLEEVDEKGDVFSLAKVFWAMVNGERGVVFPGPVWFEEEYDLGKIYPNESRIHHAMLLVSRGAAVRPDTRLSMSQFIEGLRSIADSKIPEGDETDIIEIQRAEAAIEIEFQQRWSATATFVRAMHADVHNAISRLHRENPDVLVWKKWFEEAKRTPQSADALVQQVAEQESDAPVVIVRFRRYIFITRFYPPSGVKPAKFFVSFASENDPSQRSELTVANSLEGTRYESNILGEPTESGAYTDDVLMGFLIRSSEAQLINNGR